MTQELQAQLERLNKNAKIVPSSKYAASLKHPPMSSLHEILNTREKAKAFMSILEGQKK